MSGRYPRPQRRGSGVRLFLVGVLVVLVPFGAVAGGGYAYYKGQLRSAHGTGPGTTAVVIPPGTTTAGVADILSGKGLIGNALVFQLYVRLNGFSLEAGQYQVPRGASTEDVVALLTHNQSGTAVTVTIPPGYTARQVGAVVQKKGLFSADAFLAATKQAYQVDFLAGHDPTLGLEGYLFPDTYQFSAKATPKDVVTTLLKDFGQKVTPEMRTRAPKGYSLAQVVVMASIVEREAFFDKDRAAVAGVFYNRLKAGMPLQSDATVAYAVGRAGADITEDDKRSSSPYNTYLHPGLPPAAIANPGLASLQAALAPMQTEYLFYLTDKDGHAHFSKTYAQHQQCQVNLSACPTLP